MGFRYRRTIKIGDGMRLNLSKSGTSLSVGHRGETVNFGPKGEKVTFGVPGTGMSYSHRVGGHRHRGGRRSQAAGGAWLGYFIVGLIGLAIWHAIFH